MIGWKTIGNFRRQWYYVKWWRKFWKKFSQMRKHGFKKNLPTLPLLNFFMFILLISNHKVFLVQFVIIVSFSKSWIALANAAHAISAFWKTHSCKLIPDWPRNRMITCTNVVTLLYRHKCFTGKFTTLKTHRKLHPGPKWQIFHILTSENIGDMFSQLFKQTVTLPIK